jgi:hypothetical protein
MKFAFVFFSNFFDHGAETITPSAIRIVTINKKRLHGAKIKKLRPLGFAGQDRSPVNLMGL